MELPDWMTTSEGTGELSLRLKSFIGLAIFIGGMFGLQFTDASLNELVDIIVKAIGAIGTLVSAVTLVRGWLRANTHKTLGTGKYQEVEL